MKGTTTPARTPELGIRVRIDHLSPFAKTLPVINLSRLRLAEAGPGVPWSIRAHPSEER
jgi:hypothetical protein